MPTDPSSTQAPPPIGMWDDERAHPRLAIALYLGAFAVGIVASIAAAMLGSAA